MWYFENSRLNRFTRNVKATNFSILGSSFILIGGNLIALNFFMIFSIHSFSLWSVIALELTFLFLKLFLAPKREMYVSIDIKFVLKIFKHRYLDKIIKCLKFTYRVSILQTHAIYTYPSLALIFLRELLLFFEIQVWLF